MKKQMLFKTRGMNKDLSVSAFNPEFAFENINLRLSTNESNTMLSWVNEKGTAAITLEAGKWKDTDTTDTATVTDILGSPIGIAVLNNQLVLFTTGSHIEETVIIKDDCIYVFKYKDADKTKMMGKRLYHGDLNFSTDSPLETLVSYEAENIQKVYWVDGRNQPRVINICVDVTDKPNTYFDFVPELQLKETVKVKKILGASGMFASGVIQYAFTYFNKNGQESNIFHTTPLCYISHADRGASPEEKVDNVFKITVEHIDTNFDCLRIYSIQRTSINGTPICKRIQDISIEGLTNIGTELNPNYVANYTDTGLSGDTIDPTELLYKGGKEIIAKTVEQKDSTLFLGNLEISIPQLTNKLSALPISEPVKYYDLSNHKLSSDYVSLFTGSIYTRTIYPERVVAGNYTYYNQLCSYNNISKTDSVPCGGFKKGNTYRCGVQFQHKSGTWSNPFFVEDKDISTAFASSSHYVTIPIIEGHLAKRFADDLLASGYTKVRALIAIPSYQDRAVICQGVACPTIYTQNHRTWQDNNNTTHGNNDLYAQSSWFFRAYYSGNNKYDSIENTYAVRPISSGVLEYTERNIYRDIPDIDEGVFDPSRIHHVEVEGNFKLENRFQVSWDTMTLHSPDIEFDEQLLNTSFNASTCRKVGTTTFSDVRSTVNIQTETPPIAGDAGGALNLTSTDNDGHGFISGLFYDDGTVEDSGNNPTVIQRLHSGSTVEPCTNKWLVYPWQANGSLNNDIHRGTNQGIASAILKKKILSNYRYCSYVWDQNSTNIPLVGQPQIFSSEEVSVVKLGVNSNIYQGNIETMLYPDNWDGKYFAFNSSNIMNPNVNTPIDSIDWWKTFSRNNYTGQKEGLYKWNGTDEWEITADEGQKLGNQVLGLVMKKNPVSMKYKSTPHLVFMKDNSEFTNEKKLPILEFCREVTSPYGGTSLDALKENTWIPCGEPVRLDNLTTHNEGAEDEYQSVDFEYSYGDTYFQRWECLKTYPFTKEDLNQIIEIGSFMLETYTNIDGRYDRNRGQQNNVSPQNFNLMNPVYSQKDNFFSYKIIDDEEGNVIFPNQITWGKTKENGADVDLWTNVTLASTLELDGDKGEITSLQRINNNLIAFQDTGISRIMYNDNVQIQSTAGVPIEIANSGKVQGKDYLSDTVGCSNKWSIVSTPSGLYFADSKGKNIYLFNGQLANISDKFGMSSWVKNNFFGDGDDWNPTFHSHYAIVSYYDRQNQDVLFINEEKCLAFSEKLGAFTSLYNYEDTPYFVNLEDTGIWVRRPYTTGSVGSEVHPPTALWKHQAGSYCRFFGENKPYSMTLIGNPEPQLDKIFTNLEFRASVVGDGEYDGNTDKFTPTLPFDSLEAWNEYQHGYAQINIRNGYSGMVHHLDNISGAGASLKRKFRIWRCDIPRNNCVLDSTTPRPEVDYGTDASLGISRYSRKPMDRMRNPWLYLKLTRNKATGTHVEGGQTVPNVLPKAEIHDVMMTYFV